MAPYQKSKKKKLVKTSKAHENLSFLLSSQLDTYLHTNLRTIYTLMVVNLLLMFRTESTFLSLFLFVLDTWRRSKLSTVGSIKSTLKINRI